MSSLKEPINFAVTLCGVVDSSICIMIVPTPVRFKLKDDFAGSQVSVGTNPSASRAFSIKKDGTQIGTLTINTSGVGTWLLTPDASKIFEIGDVLSIDTPASISTLADVGIVIVGDR